MSEEVGVERKGKRKEGGGRKKKKKKKRNGSRMAADRIGGDDGTSGERGWIS